MDIIDSTLADFAEHDLKELWDSDYYTDALKAASDLDWTGVLDSASPSGTPGVVLNDRLMTEASLGVLGQLGQLGQLGTILAAHGIEPQPAVKVDHSYSLTVSTQESTLSDLESECYPAIPLCEAVCCVVAATTTTTTITATTTTTTTITATTPTTTSTTTSLSHTSTLSTSSTQQEGLSTSAFKRALMSPMSPLISRSPSPEVAPSKVLPAGASPAGSPTVVTMPSIRSSLAVCRPSSVVVTQRSQPGLMQSTSRLGLNSLTLRLPTSASTTSTDAGFPMPPTPPSCCGSDTECGTHSPRPTQPLYEVLTPQFCNPRKNPRPVVASRHPINTPLISTQPISAQESRRKKKDYMDALERKVERLSTENLENKRRIEVLQSSNSQLLLQLQRLQHSVEQDEKYRIRSTPIATLLA